MSEIAEQMFKMFNILRMFIIIRGEIQTYMALFEKVMHPPSIAVAAAKRVAQSVIRFRQQSLFVVHLVGCCKGVSLDHGNDSAIIHHCYLLWTSRSFCVVYLTSAFILSQNVTNIFPGFIIKLFLPLLIL